MLQNYLKKFPTGQARQGDSLILFVEVVLVVADGPIDIADGPIDIDCSSVPTALLSGNLV